MAQASGKDMTNKLATQQQSKQPMTVTQFFEKQIPSIAAVMPKGIMDPKRMAKLAIQIWTGDDRLAACSKDSFLAALITCAQFGLEPNTPLGQAFIIPYGNKATFQLGYQGLLALAYRTGEYKQIYVREVYKDDEFNVSYGIFEDLVHIPSDDGPADGELPTHIYAVYHLKNGGYSFECWSWNKIIKHAKKYSKSYSKKDGGWQTNPISMAKKTVLIAVLKYAPKSLEMMNAMESDDTTQAAPDAKREYIDAEYSFTEQPNKTEAQPEQLSEDISKPGQTDQANSDTALAFEQQLINQEN